MAEHEEVTCPTCGATFTYEDMAPRDPGEDQNTQVDWLVAGRCPNCTNTVTLSFEQLQKIAARVEAEED